MDTDVVTGAFGYTGRYIAARLVGSGRRVRTLTGHPDRPNPFGEKVTVARLQFDDPVALARSLEGASTLYNTYWIRFPYRGTSFGRAVANTKVLIKAAKAAGVRRIVHLSITNASERSRLPYFRGKGMVERAIRESNLAYAILRPTVIFGPEDILINNIAWLLRRFPIFVVPGTGRYRLQPVFVDDVAALAVEAGMRTENEIFDAVGPEVYTYNQLVRAIARKIGRQPRIVHLLASVTLLAIKGIGCAMGDVVLTREELAGLQASLLVSDKPPTGHMRLSDWLSKNARILGTRYASELRRHYR